MGTPTLVRRGRAHRLTLGLAAVCVGAGSVIFTSTSASAEVERETIVQEWPGGLPTDDRNIVCANDPAAADFNEYQYWLTGGRSVYQLTTVTAPNTTVMTAVGHFEDVTAVRSDDTGTPPRQYEVEGSATFRTVEHGNGSMVSFVFLRGSISDSTTGEVVDVMDNATIDRGDGPTFLYNRGNCG